VKLEDITKAKEKLEKKIEKIKETWDYNKNFQEYENALDPYWYALLKLEQQEKLLIEDYTLEDIPFYGDVMSLEDFVQNVKSGGFIDYDGIGKYISGDKMTSIQINPSDVKANMYRKDFDKIVWFNK